MSILVPKRKTRSRLDTGNFPATACPLTDKFSPLEDSPETRPDFLSEKQLSQSKEVISHAFPTLKTI